MVDYAHISESLNKFQEFIGFDSSVYKYLHNTGSVEIAKKIVREGFEFEKYLENTTDLLSGVDLVVLKYFLLTRYVYGHYTMVIQIGKELAAYYSERLPDCQHHFTEILTDITPRLSVNSEFIYRLPRQFIKGYFNHDTSEAEYNPDFNPHYNPEIFKKNLEDFLTNYSKNED